MDDLVDALIRMMDTHDDVTGPINVGNPGEFTVMQLAEKVIALTGSKSIISREPLPAHDLKQRRPDISLAKAILAWQPATQLDDGLRNAIEYFRNFVAP